MDKTSKQIIKFIRQQPNHEYRFAKGRQTIMSHDEFERCIVHMVTQNYVYPIYSKGIVIGYGLTHQMVHKREFTWIAFKHYIRDNWIAILALIISIISIVLSPFFSAFFASLYQL